MTKKGLSILEILVATTILSIMLLAFADFSAITFGVSYKHNQEIQEIDQTRYYSDRIVSEINKSVYIYPKGYEISLLIGGNTTKVINTNNAVAMIIPVDEEGSPPTYRFTAFYLDNDDNGKANLCEFHSGTEFNWTENTIPSQTITSLSGSAGVISSDISVNDSSLDYTLNYDNGITDTILKGSVANSFIYDNNALIKGIDWNLVIYKNKKVPFSIKGVSYNVPRFIG